MSASETAATLAGAPLLDVEHPWPGLDAFPESGSTFFHGRDREINRLMRLVRDEPLVLVYGESGLGKTSLLQAGLFPPLRQQDLLPVLVRLDFSHSARPLAQQVRDRVGEELTRESVEGPRPQADERLWEYSHRPDGWLWSPRQTPLLPVVVLDQFEELFTLGGGLSAPGTRDFVDELAEVVLDRVPARDIEQLDDFDRARVGLKVVLSFREEFLAHVEQLLQEFGPALLARLRLTAFDQAVAHRSVIGNGGALVGPEVAQRIVRVVSGGRDTVEPSLLSVFCRELNERRLSADAPTISTALVEDAGAAVLPAFYTRSVHDVAEPVLEFVEEKLLTEGQRRNIVTLEEAVAAPGVTRAALETLVHRRLLRIEERFGAERVELAHDVLAPIVAEARRERRARRDERRLKEQLELEQHESQKLGKERRRLRALLAVAMLGLVFAILGAVVAWRASLTSAKLAEQAKTAERDSVLKQKEAEEARKDAEQLKHAAEVAKDDANSQRALTEERDKANRRLLYVANMNLVQRASEENDFARMKEILTGYLPGTATAGQEQLRGFEWYRLWHLQQKEPATLKVLSREAAAQITAVVFSADGKSLAAAGDNTVALFDTSDPRKTATMQVDRDNFHALAFSPDGTMLATMSNGTVRIWATQTPTAGTRKPTQVFKVPRQQYASLAFSTNGKMLAVAGSQTVVLWDTGNGREMAPLPLPAISVAFSPDGRTLAVRDEATVKLLDVSNALTETASIKSMNTIQDAMTFSPDGKTLAVAEGNAVTLWDTATWKEMKREPIKASGNFVLALAYSPDGRTLATGSDDTAQLWDAATGKEVPTFMRSAGGRARAVAISPDGRTLAAGSVDGTVKLWDISWRQDQLPLEKYEWGVLDAVAFSPDGHILASSAAGNGVDLWDTRTRRRIATIHGHTKNVASLAFSGNGELLATGSGDGTAKIWRIQKTLKEEPLFSPSNKSPVELVAFSPDDRIVAIGVQYESLKLWDRQANKLGPGLNGACGGVKSVAFSPDGVTLATACNEGLKLWDLRTRNQVSTPRGSFTGSSVAWSPDGRVLAIADGNDLKLWDLLTQAVEAVLKGHSKPVSHVAFSPDGKTLASGGYDDSVRLWDTRTGQELAAIKKDFAGGLSIITALTFSSTGEMLAIGSMDGNLRLWYAATTNDLAAHE